jgi:hypothetical protein
MHNKAPKGTFFWQHLAAAWQPPNPLARQNGQLLTTQQSLAPQKLDHLSRRRKTLGLQLE